MATVYRDPRARTKINYIATAPFDVNFYNYTQTKNPNTFEVTGALSAVSGASAAVCPKGRILRENGKRLFPGGSYPGISTFMVGVFDANSGLSGYIDPNAECFAYYNVDKPVEVVDGVDPSGNVVHRGASVYTSGNLLADGNLDVGGYADISGNLTVAGTADVSGNLTVGTASANANVVVRGNVTATKQVIASNVYTTTGGGTQSIDVSTYSHAFISGIGSNITINFTGIAIGARIDIYLQKDGSSGAGTNYSISFGSGSTYNGNTVTNFTTTANSKVGITLVALSGSQMYNIAAPIVVM